MHAITTTTNPTPRTHDAFLRILPAIDRHARASFRSFRCPHDRDDAVAEVIARAWEQFLTAPNPLAVTADGLAILTADVHHELIRSHP